MLQHEKDRGQMKNIKRSPLQKIFKYTCIVLLTLTIYCAPAFLKFKQYAHENKIHFVSSQAWYWCIAGFVAYGVIKQAYYHLFTKHMDFVVKSKFQGQVRLYRLKSIAKQSFDTLFYLSTSFTGYYLFRDQYWFPKLAGGVGQCQNIFRQYPNWPSQQTISSLEWFYMTQLGKFLYNVAESMIFRRADRKYYEFLLHHFVATALILYSMLTNVVAVGTVILVIHDVCDIPSAFVRGFIDTKYDNTPTTVVSLAIWLGSWCFLRVYVFPTCLISQLYNTYVDSSKIWQGIKLEYGILWFLCSVLVVMHIFWIISTVKYAIEVFFGQKKEKIIQKKA